MTENRGYMQRYAMLFGTYMGGFWILKFILFPVGLSVPTVFMYMFAALLAAVAHYIYFRFIDHGYVINTCETMVDTLAQSNMPGMDSYIATYQEALETARLLSPIDITLQMISSNVFWGSILAFPTALFVMRRKKDDAPAE